LYSRFDRFDFSQDSDESLSVELEAARVLDYLRNIVCFIDDENVLFEIDVKSASDTSIWDVVVWHQDYISSLCTHSIEIVRTKLVLLGKHVQIFNINRVPWDKLTAIELLCFFFVMDDQMFTLTFGVRIPHAITISEHVLRLCGVLSRFLLVNLDWFV